jgi:Ca-activated chloride channel family protein
MLAEDISPNRLGRAKLAALELMQRARADRLGLVAFAGTAFLQCPLP